MKVLRQNDNDCTCFPILPIINHNFFLKFFESFSSFCRDSTQNIDDTVSIEAVEIANADPAILPFARLRTLQSFVSQCGMFS